MVTAGSWRVLFGWPLKEAKCGPIATDDPSPGVRTSAGPSPAAGRRSRRQVGISTISPLNSGVNDRPRHPRGDPARLSGKTPFGKIT